MPFTYYNAFEVHCVVCYQSIVSHTPCMYQSFSPSLLLKSIPLYEKIQLHFSSYVLLLLYMPYFLRIVNNILSSLLSLI